MWNKGKEIKGVSGSHLSKLKQSIEDAKKSKPPASSKKRTDKFELVSESTKKRSKAEEKVKREEQKEEEEMLEKSRIALEKKAEQYEKFQAGLLKQDEGSAVVDFERKKILELEQQEFQEEERKKDVETIRSIPAADALYDPFNM